MPRVGQRVYWQRGHITHVGHVVRVVDDPIDPALIVSCFNTYHATTWRVGVDELV